MTTNQRAGTEEVVELEFRLTAEEYPFVAIATEADARAALEEFLPRGDGEFAELFTVAGVDEETVFDHTSDHPDVREVQLLARHDDGGLFEFVVGDGCPIVHLGRQGAVPRTARSAGEEGRLLAEVPPGRSAEAVASAFLEAHGDAELVRRQPRGRVTPLLGRRDLGAVAEELLTDRQLEVLRAAHDADYYEWPRETSGEDLADRLDLAPATVYQHLRRAEGKLIGVLFEEESVGSEEPER